MTRCPRAMSAVSKCKLTSSEKKQRVVAKSVNCGAQSRESRARGAVVSDLLAHVERREPR